MVKKISTILLLIVILSSLFIAVFSSIALAKKGPEALGCTTKTYCGQYKKIKECLRYPYWGDWMCAPKYKIQPPGCIPYQIGTCCYCAIP